MTGAERGFLLLGSHLGVQEQRILTGPQLRKLTARVRNAQRPSQDRHLQLQDITALGYGLQMAEQILFLLSREKQLEYYLRAGTALGCYPLTRASAAYPRRWWAALGDDSPACVWYQGDLALLERPKVALVGSRALCVENAAFAREVGRQAALQGYVLVSGNARGSDITAQEACLQAGGSVISIVADDLSRHKGRNCVLFISEEDYDAPFSAQRALRRNRLIHSLGSMTFVAQCSARSGGTWDGTVHNLFGRHSPVFCFDDGSDAVRQLEQMGAQCIEIDELTDFTQLKSAEISLFEG